jgi:hypothetical protein
MKPNMFITLLIFLAVLCLIGGYFAGVTHEKNKVDFPEEIEAISSSFKKPDTLIGYKKNGVIHLEFKSK